MPPRPDLGPKPRLGYAGSRIDRSTERRTDLAALAKLAKDPVSRFYLIGGESVVLKRGANGHDPLFAMDEARLLGDPAQAMLLGLLDDAPRFALALAGEMIAKLQGRGDIELVDLRAIAVR